MSGPELRDAAKALLAQWRHYRDETTLNQADAYYSLAKGHWEKWDALAAALTAAPQPAPAVGEWQPIETAPKDGAWFLGWRPSRFEQDRVDVWSWYAYSPASGLWIDAADQNDPDDQPTHWQPLPAPPATPEGA